MSKPYHEDVKQFVEEKSEPFASTKEVADQWPSVSNRTIRKRLSDLVDNNELRVREIGASSKVWYPAAQTDDAKSESPSSLNQ